MRIPFSDFKNIVFFTGAGMSAESGVPTYRGRDGIWESYNWRELACQEAFDRNPEKVLKFHELRRKAVLKCRPHRGHLWLSQLQKKRTGISIITQNIDGMHQRAGNTDVVELHGSLWSVRCLCGKEEILSEFYPSYRCEKCGVWFRPDIVWFGDSLDSQIIEKALEEISRCDLFVSVGTSSVVWPAAGFPLHAKKNGAYLLQINPEPTELSHIYDTNLRLPASLALSEKYFPIEKYFSVIE
ncbi:NAD-dependent deacylase [candidate division WOR-3 bacterium]|nr:NAD-dependent deacylase [candidate division WOR-3 bacterium]